MSTSNSVFVTQSTVTKSQDNDEGFGSLQSLTSTAITAIARVDSVLELQPVSYSGEAELTKVLPVWSPGSDFISDEVGRSKESLYSEIPLPESQLESAYINLLGFAIDSGAAVVRPSANQALKVWRSLDATALENSIDLSSFFFPSALVNQEPIPGLEEAPGRETQKLKEALLRYIVRTTTDIRETSTSSIEKVLESWNTDEKTWIAKEKLLLWTGLTLLASTDDPDETIDIVSERMSAEKFLAEWRNLLPEAWRDGANNSLLSSFTTTENGHLQIANTHWPLLNANLSKARENQASSKAAGGISGGTADKKRKWHEKFKAERDARAAAKKN